MSGRTVTVTNTSTGATSYSWNFGDGYTSSQTSPSHTYSSAGTYTITLTATNSAGNSTASANITIDWQVSITRVEITTSKFSDWNLDTFDSGDIFFQFKNASGTVLLDYEDAKYNDVSQSQLPLTWNLSSAFDVTPLTSTLYVYVYDADFPDEDDLIAYTTFLPSSYLSTRPTNVVKTNGSTTVTLYLNWK
jgi:PKD repeat protein